MQALHSLPSPSSNLSVEGCQARVRDRPPAVSKLAQFSHTHLAKLLHTWKHWHHNTTVCARLNTWLVYNKTGFAGTSCVQDLLWHSSLLQLCSVSNLISKRHFRAYGNAKTQQPLKQPDALMCCNRCYVHVCTYLLQNISWRSNTKDRPVLMLMHRGRECMQPIQIC